MKKLNLKSKVVGAIKNRAKSEIANYKERKAIAKEEKAEVAMAKMEAEKEGRFQYHMEMAKERAFMKEARRDRSSGGELSSEVGNIFNMGSGVGQALAYESATRRFDNPLYGNGQPSGIDLLSSYVYGPQPQMVTGGSFRGKRARRRRHK
jgi:hypothetical protein